jgi:GT2 family glycosyltransferase
MIKIKSNIGIIIVLWKENVKLINSLLLINKHNLNKYNILIVNNKNNNYPIEIKNSLISIIALSSNKGYGGANNVGIKYHLARGAKYVFILNPDTEINKDTIPNLIRVMEKDKNIGIAGPKIYFPNGLIWSAGGEIDKKRYSGGLRGVGENDKGQYDKQWEPDYIPGTAMMIRKEVFEKIGLLPENYFLYYEDTEYSLLAKKAGFKLAFVPESTIIHHESSSTKKNSPLHQYYMARNHLYFVERNANFSIKMREMIRLPKTIYEHVKRKEKHALNGVKDYLFRNFGKNDHWS